VTGTSGIGQALGGAAGREIVLPRREEETDYGQPGSAALTYVGAGTVLLRYAGFTVLTDPSFLRKGEEAPIGYGMHTRREQEPALTIDELPPVDLVCLSHYHGDHFDQVAEERLDRELPIVTTRHAAAMLRLKGFRNAHGLPTWDRLTFAKGGARLHVTALPGNHRPGMSWLFPPVMGSLLEFHHPVSTRPLRTYVTGDTLLHGALREIPRYVPDIDYMLPHIGGTRVAGVLLTMNGEQAVKLMRFLRPKVTVPIHFHDFAVYREPLDDFQRTVREAGIEGMVRYIRHGETLALEVPPGAVAPAAAERRAA
jgi:L-ascorbate metabolism protein UlaG (beta-lactamase superfamily)